jgi:hypothetical protein
MQTWAPGLRWPFGHNSNCLLLGLQLVVVSQQQQQTSANALENTRLIPTVQEGVAVRQRPSIHQALQVLQQHCVQAKSKACLCTPSKASTHQTIAGTDPRSATNPLLCTFTSLTTVHTT